MREIVVIADSTCDLPEELIKEYDIKIVPLLVTFGEQSYRDGVEIKPDDIFARVEKEGVLPKTAATSIGTMTDVFKKYIDQDKDIIFIPIASSLSSQYSNSLLAKAEFDDNRIEIVDSQNLSTGIALLVLKAAQYVKEGLTLQEVASKVRELVPLVKSKFTVDNLNYLHKGGRCSGTAKLLGNLFQIKPILVVENNKLFAGGKVIGRKKALRFMLDDIVSNKDQIYTDAIFITQARSVDEANLVKSMIEKDIPGANVYISTAGSVISSHCGPGTIGILYLCK